MNGFSAHDAGRNTGKAARAKVQVHDVDRRPAGDGPERVVGVGAHGTCGGFDDRVVPGLDGERDVLGGARDRGGRVDGGCGGGHEGLRGVRVTRRPGVGWASPTVPTPKASCRARPGGRASPSGRWATGDGGVIVLDGRGGFAWAMNTPGMYRAHQSADGEPVVQIFADEE